MIEVPAEGYEFRIGNRSYSLSTVNGYEARYHRPPVADNYAFIITHPGVLVGDRAEGQRLAAKAKARPELEWGTVFDIAGLGAHALMRPKSLYLDGDYPVLVPLDGQNASPQAAKRCAQSAHADSKRPTPRYDNS